MFLKLSIIPLKYLNVTSKEYALLHIIVSLVTKFQLYYIKIVGGVIRKQTC